MQLAAANNTHPVINQVRNIGNDPTRSRHAVIITSSNTLAIVDPATTLEQQRHATITYFTAILEAAYPDVHSFAFPNSDRIDARTRGLLGRTISQVFHRADIGQDLHQLTQQVHTIANAIHESISLEVNTHHHNDALTAILTSTQELGRIGTNNERLRGELRQPTINLEHLSSRVLKMATEVDPEIRASS